MSTALQGPQLQEQWLKGPWLQAAPAYWHIRRALDVIA